MKSFFHAKKKCLVVARSHLFEIRTKTNVGRWQLSTKKNMWYRSYRIQTQNKIIIGLPVITKRKKNTTIAQSRRQDRYWLEKFKCVVCIQRLFSIDIFARCDIHSNCIGKQIKYKGAFTLHYKSAMNNRNETRNYNI